MTSTYDPFNMFQNDSMTGQIFQMSLMPKATKVANSMLDAQASQATAMAFMAKKSVLDSLEIELPVHVKTQVLADLGLSAD